MKVEVLAEGALRAGGAGAVVRLRITCARELVSSNDIVLRAFVELAQRTDDGRVAASGGFRELGSCGPVPRTVLVATGAPIGEDFDPVLGARPLRVGPAAVRASVVHCVPGDDDCSGARSLEVQRLVQRTDLDRSVARGRGVRLRLLPSVTILAEGAAVRFRVPYACSGASKTATFSVRQAVRGAATTVRSIFSTALQCDGTRHVLRAEELASGDHAFLQRPAWLQVSVQGCDPGCGTLAQAWREVAPVGAV